MHQLLSLISVVLLTSVVNASSESNHSTHFCDNNSDSTTCKIIKACSDKSDDGKACSEAIEKANSDFSYSLVGRDQVLTNACYSNSDTLNCKLMQACTTESTVNMCSPEDDCSMQVSKIALCNSILVHSDASKATSPGYFLKYFDQYLQEVADFNRVEMAKENGDKAVISSIHLKPVYNGFCKPGELNTKKQLSCLMASACVREDLIRKDMKNAFDVEPFVDDSLSWTQSDFYGNLKFTASKATMGICKSLLVSSQVATSSEAEQLLTDYFGQVFEYVRANPKGKPMNTDSLFEE